MFEGVKNFVRQVVGRMTGWGDIRRAMSSGAGAASGVVSDTMERAIELWGQLYANRAPWISGTCKSLNLPATIAAEVARLVTLEAEITVSGEKSAEYLQEQIQATVEKLRKWTEYACAFGGVVFKPFVAKDGISVDCVLPANFVPTSFDSRGNMTGAVFADRIYRGQEWYTRLESHGFDGEIYRITNKAYKSDSESQLGREISLQQVQEWADIEPEVTVENLSSPLFSYFRIPLANQVDAASPLGVSVYSRAVDLIKEADAQYSRILWEYEGAELAVDASADLFRRDKDGKPVLPKGRERLFRALDLDTLNTNGMSGAMQTFSPDIRDSSLFNGLDQLLKQIESRCGLSYGTISKMEETAKTATEIRASRQRLHATVTDIQKSLEDALRHLVECMDVLAVTYRLNTAGKWELTAKWDDSIVTDADTERMKDKEDVRDGIMQKWEYRMKWYGEDEETAKKAVSGSKTDAEWMGFSTGGGE